MPPNVEGMDDENEPCDYCACCYLLDCLRLDCPDESCPCAKD